MTRNFFTVVTFLVGTEFFRTRKELREAKNYRIALPRSKKKFCYRLALRSGRRNKQERGGRVAFSWTLKCVEHAGKGGKRKLGRLAIVIPERAPAESPYKDLSWSK